MIENTPPEVSNPGSGLLTLAIDIGGTGIKALVLSPAGEIALPRQVLPTPKPATPAAILKVIQQLAGSFPQYDRIAIGFPGVVQRGVTITAPNLDSSWRRFALEVELERLLQKPVRVANDADVQGFGAIEGTGVELVITLGTGMGSALFVDGILVPNLELAHHPFADGKTYEQWLGQASLQAIGELPWMRKLLDAIDLMKQTFNFDTLYLGGGNARKINPVDVPAYVRLVPNIAGLLGGIALWNSVHGTTLMRAPHSEGAHCVIEATPGISPPA